MAHTLRILTKENKILRTPAAEIEPRVVSKKTVQELIENMKETLDQTPEGIGLAAPQVGTSLQLFIIAEEAKTFNPEHSSREEKRQEKMPKRKYEIFVNPKLKKLSRKKVELIEGCLSVPGLIGPVLRAEKVVVEALDEHGKKFLRGASGFFARVIQHEYDHLQGILFADRAREIFPIKEESKIILT